MRQKRDVQRSDPPELSDALTALFPHRVVDQSAFTIEELLAYSNLGRAQTARRVKDAVIAGTWEEVFKVAGSGRMVKAYRAKK